MNGSDQIPNEAEFDPYFYNPPYDDIEIDPWTPLDIKKYLDKSIVGNELPKKELSLILYNTLRGRRSVSLFIGPSGCGKTEMLRVLQHEYRDMIYILDGTSLTATGWKGLSIADWLESNHITGRSPALIAIDEFDKLISPAYSGSGQQCFNVSDMIQSSLLKLFDGDRIEYESTVNKSKTFYVNSANISIVLLGAFSSLWEQRRHPVQAKHLGFGTCEQSEEEPDEISIDDVIAWGCKPELAARVTRIILMDDPDLNAMTEIGYHTVKKIEEEYSCKISIDSTDMESFARTAIDKGLGARYIRTQILRRMDEIQFDRPSTTEYRLTK